MAITELLPLSSAILSGHVDLVLCIPYYMSLGSVGTRLRISMCADSSNSLMKAQVFSPTPQIRDSDKMSESRTRGHPNQFSGPTCVLPWYYPGLPLSVNWLNKAGLSAPRRQGFG